MTDTTGAQQMPAVGTQMLMPITPAPTRPLIVPDQILIAGAPGNYLEIICLRQELFVLSQVAVVQSVKGGAVDVKPGEVQLAPQLCDIGHVRVSIQSAKEAALAMLQHLVKNEGADVDAIVDEFRKVAES